MVDVAVVPNINKIYDLEQMKRPTVVGMVY